MTRPQQIRWRCAAVELVARLGARPRGVTAGPPHVRAPCCSERLFALFVVASLPAALVGAWNTGRQAAPGQALEAADALAGGLAVMLPVLAVAAVTAFSWEVVFAAVRRRPVDSGWTMASWLYVMLLPAGTPLVFVAAGMSFGAVFAQQLFGGSGRYIASPALVGALFLQFAYPSLLPADSTRSTLVAGGAAALDWWPLFAGRETGLFGTVSALACVAGALALVVVRAASPRTLAGGMLGFGVAAGVAASLGDGLAPHWHAALGTAAFGWAFLLTDPTTMALTRGGRWLHGALFGGLVILIREADPTHPDGTLFAVLLAGLAVPLVDSLALRAGAWRRGGGLELDT